MAPITFISWIYHFLARFWPYFNFVDFRAYFGHFSHVKKGKQRLADLVMKMTSNQKMQENKPTLKFNFTIEKRWPVSKFSFWHSHRALLCILQPVQSVNSFFSSKEQGEQFKIIELMTLHWTFILSCTMSTLAIIRKASSGALGPH